MAGLVVEGALAGVVVELEVEQVVAALEGPAVEQEAAPVGEAAVQAVDPVLVPGQAVAAGLELVQVRLQD